MNHGQVYKSASCNVMTLMKANAPGASWKGIGKNLKMSVENDIYHGNFDACQTRIHVVACWHVSYAPTPVPYVSPGAGSSRHAGRRRSHGEKDP